MRSGSKRQKSKTRRERELRDAAFRFRRFNYMQNRRERQLLLMADWNTRSNPAGNVRPL